MSNVAADRLLTVKQVADILALKEMSVYKMIYRGDLRAVKVGGRTVRVRESDLKAIIKPLVDEA